MVGSRVLAVVVDGGSLLSACLAVATSGVLSDCISEDFGRSKGGIWLEGNVLGAFNSCLRRVTCPYLPGVLFASISR